MDLLDWKSIGRELRGRLKDYDKTADVRAAGQVLSCGDGIVRLDGLDACRYGELLEFECGGFGIVMNLEENEIGAVLLGTDADVAVGMRAYGTGQVLSVPTGDRLLGRVVNPLGQPLDGGSAILPDEYRRIEAPAPGVLLRQQVAQPLETGILSIDAMIPIGRGQRELIIGDRQTGKTSVAVDTILNQKGKNVACFYVAIGQKASSVAQVIEQLRRAGAMAYTTVVCATASDSATMQYIAPYCGCAMAEHFMYTGRDALIVYDDLSKHAVAYRAMSLLLKRPPGREAFPGDVFYLHSRLLERAAKLSDDLGAGSMTALPIIETQSGDISSYIPTNVISITDGQIFLDTELFRENVRPAVNVGLSVSRVGGAAQSRAIRSISSQLRLDLAQYRELQIFSQFSSDLDTATQDTLRYGAILTELLKQRNSAPLSMPVQAALLYCVTRGFFPPTLGTSVLARFKQEFPALLFGHDPELAKRIEETGELDDEARAEIEEACAYWRQEAGV